MINKLKLKLKHKLFLRIIFSLVGLFSLVKIIMNYGLYNMIEELDHSGFLLIILSLTFIPTLICYSASWLLASEHQSMFGNLTIFKKMTLFIRFTVESIAWNNLTPFLKIGGEPLKYMKLLEFMPKSKALTSTINYNIIHLLATAICFVITAIMLSLFYNVPVQLRLALYSFVSIFIMLIVIGLLAKRKRLYLLAFTYRYQFRAVRVLTVNLNVAMKKVERFYKRNTRLFFLSLCLDIIARFVEGITFYFGFFIIKKPISLINSSFLDVGRTLIDTIFFFVPYQIGSREVGIRFFMEKVLVIESGGFLSVVFLYRFVEIVWMFIGYSLWVSTRSSSREFIV